MALAGEGGVELTRADVATITGTIAGQLSAAGVTRTGRVAIAVSNGPGAALAFLGAAAAGVAAPLNPAYTVAEFRFALEDLPAALLVTDGTVAAASEAARALGLREIRLGPGFVAEGIAAGECAPPAATDVALVLHTSGTTGRPKRVPLTHANLTSSARNVAASLGLTPADRCLNLMPLFHIHGLVAALLASLGSGGAVVCSPGFDAFRVFGWLETFRPTWYSAVPTMHQAILARARGRETTVAHSLRFARSSSSALPPAVLHGVEALFGVPLVEAYGMTEASHQIASNPLPPSERRPGSVGLPRGVEVGVFGAGGSPVPAGATGEVAIRGDSVTAGYEGIERSGFTFPGGWLRTGDEGYFDAGGYLYLTGRLKEMINRGGEKISPREVEDALLAHPSVAEAVVFSVPHDKLGEDVGAAVRLVTGAAAPGTAELRAFAGQQLAPFKVPRTIVVVDQIPLGPTGKPQRIGMAGRLGLA